MSLETPRDYPQQLRHVLQEFAFPKFWCITVYTHEENSLKRYYTISYLFQRRILCLP